MALYIDSFTPVGFVTPDGVDAMQFWRVTRGAPGFAVRAEFEVPASKPYVVGECPMQNLKPVKVKTLKPPILGTLQARPLHLCPAALCAAD